MCALQCALFLLSSLSLHGFAVEKITDLGTNQRFKEIKSQVQSVRHLGFFQKGPSTFEQCQLQKMYEIFKKSGDMRLVVEIKQNEQEMTNQSRKRKRVMESEEGLNGKEEDNTMRMSSEILIDASHVFERMLKCEMAEKRTMQITVCAESLKDVDDMLYCMCTGTLREDANAMRVLKLAHYYEAGRLLDKCMERLIDQLSVDTFVETVNLYARYEIDGMRRSLLDFGHRNAAEIEERDDYKTLPFLFRGMLKQTKPFTFKPID